MVVKGDIRMSICKDGLTKNSETQNIQLWCCGHCSFSCESPTSFNSITLLYDIISYRKGKLG